MHKKRIELICKTAIKPYILSQCHKRLISGIQKNELFRSWAPNAKAFDARGSSIILRTSISQSFWEYDYLLEASGFLGRQQQLLAEAQYSEKFKLKFVRILVTHPIYTVGAQKSIISSSLKKLSILKI